MIFDALGNYTWLYVGSAAVGLGAFLIAMTFRPFPKEERSAMGELAGSSV
jgi:hypothetical protein